MEESEEIKEKKKQKSERRRSSTKVEGSSSLSPPSRVDASDEVKKFKENLLQSISNGESILSSENVLEPPVFQRSRSASRARDNLIISGNVINELDEQKIFELKEAFLLFDMNGDGVIDHNDLRGTLVSLGETVDEQALKNMLSEAPSPLDFNGFVNLLGFKTLDLDSEETLVSALSRWDKNQSGLISEERIRHDLMTWGDRFSEKEADIALEEAPIVKKGADTWIDYMKFCSVLCGLRKSHKSGTES